VIEAGLLAGASDDAGQSVNVAGEWAHETAGSGRSPAPWHMLKHMLGKRWENAITNLMPGYGRPQARHRIGGRTISRHCGGRHI